MAEQLKGKAIIAVCDLSENPGLGRRERADTGTLIIYRDGAEVARTVPGAANPAFVKEMQLMGIAYGG